MQTPAMREKLFNVRFSDEEWSRVERLCEHHGINAAALFRMLLKKEERVVEETAPALSAKKAKK